MIIEEILNPKLIEMISDGKWIVAEDYLGTGIAWGMVGGATAEEIEEINSGLLEADSCRFYWTVKDF